VDASHQLAVLVAAGVATVAIVLALLFIARRDRRLAAGRTSLAVAQERRRAAAEASAPGPTPPVAAPELPGTAPGSAPTGIPGPSLSGVIRPAPVPAPVAHQPRLGVAVSRSTVRRVRRLIVGRRLSFGRRPGA
jgi:hypothetical protein